MEEDLTDWLINREECIKSDEKIENFIEELTKVRPGMLSEEGLKLFNTIMAILDERDKLKKENEKLEEKLMYALSPTSHELATTTQESFKKIIRENIQEDTYTIREKLKDYWEGDANKWMN